MRRKLLFMDINWTPQLSVVVTHALSQDLLIFVDQLRAQSVAK